MKNFNTNLILAVDSYKLTHWSQFPAGLSYTQYYTESRGGKYDATIQAGNALLAQELSTVITMDDVNEANEFCKLHFGREVFYLDAWTILATELFGKLPLRVRAVPEGTLVPVGHPLVLFESTDPRFGFLPGHFETMNLRSTWYATTVATESFEAKKIILEYLKKTADDSVIPQVLPFRLHDFGARGVSSAESSAIGGLAHLYNFMGTDNIEALVLARNLFNCPMAGYSIPAREHSTTTIYTEAGEDDAFMNSIEQWGDGLYACVMDSYDYEGALERVTTGEIKERIIALGGTFVCRPDSGKPVDVVMKALEVIGKNVGYTYNSKGYKVLHPSYRVIQGDGVTTQEIGRILSWMESHKWSAENVAFGMGGGLLQHMNRDTQRFATKCCAAIVNDQYVPVFKRPLTDLSKSSKQGFLDLVKVDGEYVTVSTTDYDARDHKDSALVVIFENGEDLASRDLTEIRQRTDEAAGL